MTNINKTELEKIFSDLAYTHLRDKSNSLLDYLLGFQLLKAEDDGKRAAGFFGFEIDGQIYYAPVFFLHGEVRGLGSLYAVEKDMFFPMTDDIINSIINRADIQIGSRAAGSKKQRGVREPNYDQLKTIPGGTRVKLGAAKDAAPRMLGIPAADVMGLPEQIRLLGKQAAVDFFTTLKKSAALRELVTEHYDLLDFVPAPEVKTAAAAEKKLIIIGDVTDPGVEDLTDAQRQDVLAGGVAVVDERSDDDRSILYKQETERQLENPSDPGMYDILMHDGAIEKMFCAPVHDHRRKLIMLTENGDRCALNRGDRVFAVRSYGVTGLRDYLVDKPVPSDARVGDNLVLVSMDGACTIPYTVVANSSGLDDSVVLRVRPFYYHAEGAADWRGADIDRMQMNSRLQQAQDVEQIIITPEKTTKPLYFQSKIVVSDKHFRLLRLPKMGMDSGSCIEPGEFGDYNTLWTQMDKVACACDVWKSGEDVLLKTASELRTLRGRGAYDYLVREQGLSKEAADELLAEASTYKARYWIKRAAITFPEPSEPTTGGEMSAYHLTQTPETLTVVDQDREDGRDAYQYQSPFAGGDDSGGEQQSVLARIEAASKTGDKEVFDATALATLIKSHVPTDLVDRYMPSITVGMDRIGRILFLIYWHYKSFAERYGEDELADIIDNLNSVFEQLGDMVVNLKSRTIAGDPEHFGLGLGPETEVDNG